MSNNTGLRARIIQAATELFSEQGYSATSIRQVVERCDCTKPSLYYYFENKETLFSEVVAMHLAASDAVIEALAAREGPTRECIHGCLSAFADWATENPSAMRLLQRIETQNEEGAPVINMARAREMHLTIMRDVFERGMKAGEVRTDLDPFECALIIAGSLSFQFEMYLASDKWDRSRLHRTVDMIFDGIAA